MRSPESFGTSDALTLRGHIKSTGRGGLRMRRAGLLIVLAALAMPAATATAASPLSISPQRVNFGTKPVGTTTFKTIKVMNTSGESLLVAMTGGLPDDFGWGPVDIERDLCVFSGAKS